MCIINCSYHCNIVTETTLAVSISREVKNCIHFTYEPNNFTKNQTLYHTETSQLCDKKAR